MKLNNSIRSFLSFFKAKESKEEFYNQIPEEDAQEFRFFDELYEHFSAPVQQGVNEVRRWTTRGLSGGLIAALTLLGTEAFSSQGPVPQSIRWIVVIFILGLAFQLLRQFVLIYMDVLRRRYVEEAHVGGRMLEPPRYLECLSSFFDIGAMIMLFAGVTGGIFTLLAPLFFADPVQRIWISK